MAALLTVGVDLSRNTITANLPSGTTFSKTTIVATTNNGYRIEEQLLGGGSYVKIINPQKEVILYNSNFPGGENHVIAGESDFGVVTSVNEDAFSYPYLLRESDKKVYGISEDKNLIELGFDGAGFHNSIYRGKNLGSEVTKAQFKAINDGSFNDLYIGDYWTINDINWRIAAFDYYFNAASTTHLSSTKHHVVIVPDTVLSDARMNDTASTSGGYRWSEMSLTNLVAASTIIGQSFNPDGGSNLLLRPIMVTTEVTNGKPSNAMMIQMTVELMTEGNVFGSSVLGPVCNGENAIAYQSFDNIQYPLFRLNPSLIHIHHAYWLRDVYDDTGYCLVDDYGRPGYAEANTSQGFRPMFTLLGKG